MKNKIELHEICFNRKFSKLSSMCLNFTTVRWLDTLYKIGHIYEIFYVLPSKRKIHLGSARLMRIELKSINQLGSVFSRMDADCDFSDFVELMREYYGHKKHPRWRGAASEIQVLYLQKIFFAKSTQINEQLMRAREEPLIC